MMLDNMLVSGMDNMIEWNQKICYLFNKSLT